MHSPTAHALSIEELVERVIKFAEIKTVAACAQVCRLWSLPALDKAWGEIGVVADGPELADLFKLLPATTNMDDEEMDVVHNSKEV